MPAQTVTGPVQASALGVTLPHEHVIFGYPGYQGDVTLGGFDHGAVLAQCLSVAEVVKARGVQTVVDATPNECGRDPLFLREVAEQSGLNILCSSGYYYEGEGGTAYFKFRFSLGDGFQEVYDMMLREVTEGIGGTGVRAGVLKIASGRDAISPYESVFFRAAARVQRETGVPIITHTQEGRLGPQQAEMLVGEGADPSRIVIGHMDGNTDLQYHLDTLAHGVTVGFDRIGLQGLVGTPPDSERLRLLEALTQQGHAGHITLSHDSIWNWLGRPLVLPDAVLPAVKDWHPAHIHDDILPELLRRGVTQEQITQMTVSNPARIFG